MKPHPRIRKTAKWAGAVASVLLLAAWLGSRWYYASWTGRSGVFVVLEWGLLGVGKSNGPPLFTGVDIGWTVPDFNWWFAWGHGAWSRYFSMPLWVPTAAALLVTMLAWRLDSRARRLSRPGACPKCGYDRAGLDEGAVCPECGAQPVTCTVV